MNGAAAVWQWTRSVDSTDSSRLGIVSDLGALSYNTVLNANAIRVAFQLKIA